MIIPYLAGLLSPLKAPMTYLLLVINLVVFAATWSAYTKSDSAIDQFLDDETFIRTQGSAFAVMIQKEPARFSETLRALAKAGSRNENLSLEALGSLALRNNSFMARAQTFDFGGDDVAIENWRLRLKTFMKLQDQNPSYLFGLSQIHNEWLNWFTYQFAHAGFAHLFWNMIFLMIFGCFVESQLGGSFVLIGYIVGGLAGAACYSSLSGLSYSPLVGASGAVSGLIGLVTVAWWGRERLPFLYMLIPSRDYMGLALLPSWLLGLVYLLPDLSHYLASTSDIGSVAYTAHIGGALFGGLIAIGVLSGALPKKQKASPLEVPSVFESQDHHAA